MNKISVLLLSIGILIMQGKVSGKQIIPPFKFSEKNYGLYKSKPVATKNMQQSPTGEERVVKNQVLITKTDLISAKIGNDFGVIYKLTGNKKDTVQLEIEWVFPHEIVDSTRNLKFKTLRYPVKLSCNAFNGITYSLDKDFELIKGTWQLNIYYLNNIIYTKKFTLY